MDAPRLAQPPKPVEHLRERRVVGDDADRPAPVRDTGGDGLVVADVAESEDQASGRRLPGLLDPVEIGLDDASDCLLGRQRFEPHHLDEIARVRAVGRQREPAHTEVVRRQAGDTAEVRVRPGSLRWPQEIARLAGGGDHPDRQPGGNVSDEPDGSRVRGDGRLLENSRSSLATPVWRVQALCVRHLAAAAAFLAAAEATGAVEASFFSWALVRFSVPTSVSLSSPRMNASTRCRATSSWIWTGGLFMK